MLESRTVRQPGTRNPVCGALIFFIAASLLVAETSKPADAGQSLRPFSIGDAFNRRQIGEVSISPDGTLIAFGVERPATRVERYVAQGGTYGDASVSRRSDVTVVSTSDGRVLWTTNFEGSGRSASHPKWSPDGKRLAFLLTEPSAVTFLAVWFRGYARHEKLNGRPLDLVVPLRSDVTDDEKAAPFVWRDNHHLLAVTRAGVAAPLGPERLEAMESRWSRTWQGKDSLSVWDSLDRPVCGAGNALVQFDAARADAAEALANGAIKGVSVSRDGSTAVVLANRRRPPPAAASLAFPPLRNPYDMDQLVGWEVRVIPSDRSAVQASSIAEGEGPISSETLPRWSKDSTRLATMTRIVDREGRIRNGGFIWTRAGVQSFSTDSFAAARLRVFGAVGATPRAMKPAIQNPKSDPLARFVGHDVRGRLIFTGDAPEGSSIYAVDRHGTRFELATFNTHFSGIERSTIEIIPYTVNGAERRGLLLLPTRLIGDGLPPIIVTAYPREGPLRTDTMATSLNNGFAHYHAPLMAHGYALFRVDFRLPSPQAATVSTKDNVLAEVLRALDALKDIRSADPKRLGFWGHSYGGYTALTLLAHTKRFSAIVAWAPLGDLAQYAYSVRPENEFDPCAADLSITSAREIEDPGGFEHVMPFLRQSAPQFVAPEKFLENSPALNLGDAVSPTLLSVGEFDGFANGARSTYLALARRGIAAQLLQFHGEEHNLQSPGNLVAQCEATLRWFDRYLRPEMPPLPRISACAGAP